VTSPCTDVCQIDPASGLCLGCRRSRDEIAGWSTMDDDARRALLVLLDGRRAATPAG